MKRLTVQTSTGQGWGLCCGPGSAQPAAPTADSSVSAHNTNKLISASTMTKGFDFSCGFCFPFSSPPPLPPAPFIHFGISSPVDLIVPKAVFLVNKPLSTSLSPALAMPTSIVLTIDSRCFQPLFPNTKCLHTINLGGWGKQSTAQKYPHCPAELKAHCSTSRVGQRGEHLPAHVSSKTTHKRLARTARNQ